VQRIRATIAYPLSGSPGVVTLYTRSTGLEDGPTAVLTGDRLKDALSVNLSCWPTSLTFTSDSFVDTMDPATGAITATTPYTPWTLTGLSGTDYLPPANQALLSWGTDAVISGRRVRGHTFLGPLPTAAAGSNGQLTGLYLGRFQAIANKWIDNGLTDTFAVVWHRPVGGAGGTAEDITSAVARSKLAVLRSRRD